MLSGISRPGGGRKNRLPVSAVGRTLRVRQFITRSVTDTVKLFFSRPELWAEALDQYRRVAGSMATHIGSSARNSSGRHYDINPGTDSQRGDERQFDRGGVKTDLSTGDGEKAYLNRETP